MWNKNRLTQILGIEYPVVQGPFGGGYSSVELTSTISSLGGLGSFGAQALKPDEIKVIIRAIREKTDKPFAINLWISDRDEQVSSFDMNNYKKWSELFAPYFDECNVPLSGIPQDLGPRYEEQIQALLEEAPPVFSFVYGIPSGQILDECRRRNIKTVGTATTVDEAMALQDAGVDAIVATGFEAGGHRVSFLKKAEESLTGLFSLIPQVADKVNIPVIAAGGIADHRGLAAAFMLGAEGVQIGTAFLATNQSSASNIHRQVLFSKEAADTTLTRVFSGRLARGVRSRLSEELKGKEELLAPFPMQGIMLRPLRAKIMEEERSDMFSFWAGQSAALIRYNDAGKLFRELIRESTLLLDRQ